MGAVRRLRVSLAGVVFAVLFAQVLLYPGVPDLVAALGATTDLDASLWFLAVEFAAFIAFAGVWGAASDVTGRRIPFVVASAALGGTGYLVLALLPAVATVTFDAILVVRAAQGAATIGGFSLAMTTLMDLPGGHGRNMGAAGIAIGLGTALGAPVGGVLSTIDPLYPLYASAGLLFGVAALTGLVTDTAPAGAREGLREVVRGLVGTPRLGIPYAFGFIDRLSAGFFALVGTFYFRTVFSLDAAGTGAALALFFAPFALLQYPFGVLSDRIGRTVPVVGGSLAYGVAVIGVGVAPSVDLARAGMFLVGVVGALMAPATMALVTDLAREGERGAAMGGFNVFGSLGFLAGVVAGGTVADRFGFLAAFLLVGGAELAVALVALPLVLRLSIAPEPTFGGRP